jgi:hypothetical protein
MAKEAAARVRPDSQHREAGGREIAPAVVARVTGLLLIVMAVAAAFAEIGVRGALVVPGDAALTAERILAAEQRFRFGLVGYLIAFLCDVPVAILLYVLLAPVDRTLSLLAASFRLVYAAIAGAALLSYSGAMTLILGGKVLTPFSAEQLQAAGLVLLTMFKNGFSLALVFFSVHLFLLAPLLVRSRRVPRIFGALMALAGASYLTDSLSFFLAPALNAKISRVLALPAMSELALALWLLVKGVKGTTSALPLARPNAEV